MMNGGPDRGEAKDMTKASNDIVNKKDGGKRKTTIQG